MNYYYSGQGSLYIAERDATTGAPKGFIAIGNVPELTLNIETTKFEHKESESGSRLIDLTIIQEKKGTFEFRLENMNLDNLALGLWGTKATVAGSTATAEVIAIPQATPAGMRFPLQRPAVSAVTVKGPSGTPTYVVTDDYTVDAANGVIILSAGGDIVTAAASAATSIEVDYTYAAHTKVDAFMTAAAPERWLRFEGINTVDNKRVIVDLFKAQFDPLTGYALLNEELGSVTMRGALLSDALRTTGSKFFRQVNVT
jgi:hypothetical protein